MRIFIPTADYPPIEGGISRVTEELARELTALGHDVRVLAPHFPGQEKADRDAPGTVMRFKGYHAGWLRLAPMYLAARRELREADLVLAINVGFGGLFGLWNHLRRGTPYVVFAYAYEFLKFHRVPPLQWLLRCVYARARVIIAISTFTRDGLVAYGVASDKIAVVHPGATLPESPSAARVEELRHRLVLDGNRIILGVGRFIARKGHLTLVRALPRILERLPDARLVLVGQGPYLHRVAREAVRLGVRDHVRLPGVLSDDELSALYAGCNVFALPTGVSGGGQVEGFGLVFAEAQAHGKPVVAGHSGGVPDVVTDGETGLLVPPDDPDALTDAILRVLADPALAQRLGKAGRARIEGELNWTAFARRVLEEAEARK